MPEYGPGSKEWLQANPNYAGGAFNHPQQGQQPGPQPIDFSAYAQDDPRMVDAYGQQQEAYNTLKGRMGADNSKRAIDHAVLGTMDAAALGAKDLGAGMARRGISGSGTGATFLQKNVFAPAQREAAGRATDIALGEQARQDDLARSLQGAAGGLQSAAGSISGQNLNNRQFGLSAWQAQQQEAIQRAQLEQQAREAEISRWMALAQGGMPPGGSPIPIPQGGSPYGSNRPSNNPLGSRGSTGGPFYA